MTNRKEEVVRAIKGLRKDVERWMIGRKNLDTLIDALDEAERERDDLMLAERIIGTDTNPKDNRILRKQVATLQAEVERLKRIKREVGE